MQPAHRGKLRALAARGLEVTVGIPQRWREPWFGRPIDATWERQGGLEIFPLPGAMDEPKYGRRALRALLRDRRPDIVQIEEDPDSIATRQIFKAARRLSIPVVLFTRQNTPPDLGLFERLSYRRMLRRLKGLVAGSDAAGAVVRSQAPHVPVAVMPQLGAEPPHEPLHTPHEGLAILFIGRLVPRKGLDNLLQALALNRAARWHLTVVGDGPEREPLEQMASELRLAARVRWTGGLPADQIAHLWQDVDVLVQPSRSLPDWRESNGHALIDAMAHEVAVLGTDSGVLPELISNAGVIVPSGDVPALAAGLDQLADEATRRQYAQAARARALRLYSDDAIAERTFEFWKGLLQ